MVFVLISIYGISIFLLPSTSNKFWLSTITINLKLAFIIFPFQINLMNTKLKTLQMIHLALCGGVFLFALITLFLNREMMFFDANPQSTKPYNPIAPIVGLITLSGSIFFSKNLLSKIDKSESAEMKINQYQSAFIISAALLEGGALFNLVVFFLTQNAFFLLFAAANWLFLIFKHPTKDKLISALQLQHPDTEAL